jgi:SAM-dependent methyltransferase
MRLLPHEDATFEVLVCVDNALPHLLTAADVTSAFAQWARVLRPGGLAIVTTREYDELLAHRPTTTPAQRSTDDAGLRTVTVQLWDWDDDHPVYQLTHLQTVEQPDRAWRTQARTTTYRAWTREELRGLAADAGLHASTWLTAAQAGLHQQTLLLRR